jgi:hypothetical protein
VPQTHTTHDPHKHLIRVWLSHPSLNSGHQPSLSAFALRRLSRLSAPRNRNARRTTSAPACSRWQGWRQRRTQLCPVPRRRQHVWGQSKACISCSTWWTRGGSRVRRCTHPIFLTLGGSLDVSWAGVSLIKPEYRPNRREYRPNRPAATDRTDRSGPTEPTDHRVEQAVEQNRW